MNEFSYRFYIELINVLKGALPLLDFAQIKPEMERFFLLRHDVEFSVEKAYDMARLEHELLGVNSSYFFQIRNYSYNPLALKNLQLIRKIADMGHKIGLHVNTSGLEDSKQIDHFIKNDCALLERGLGLPIERFSLHRPSFKLLNARIQINGLINTYDDLYFHLYEKDKPQQLNVHYFSDSEHRWKYGSPLEQLNPAIQKIQLLIHPYSWSEQGLDNSQNFKDLIAKKYQWMLEAMNSECHNFPQEFLQNEKI